MHGSAKNLKEVVTRLPEEKTVTTYSIKDESANIFAKILNRRQKNKL